RLLQCLSPFMAPSRHARRVGRCPLSGANRKTFTRLSLPLLNPKPTTEVKATMKTARSWRGVLPFTHLAREGRMTVTIGRRELLVALGGAAAAWPLGARAQQPERMRRIGVLLPYAADDREGQARLAAFQQALAELGWSDGGNVRIETRWGAGDADRYRQYAAELVALAPDVVVAVTTAVAAALQRETRSVPIVFVQAAD